MRRSSRYVVIALVCTAVLTLTCDESPTYSPGGGSGTATLGPLSATTFEDTPTLPDVALQALALSDELEASLSQDVLDAITTGLGAEPTDTVLPKALADADSALRYYEMGLEAALRGSIVTARYCFVMAVYHAPDSAEYLCKAGFAFNYVEDYQTARFFLLKALALDSQSFDIHANLAKTYEGLDDLNRAIYHMNLALAYFPNNPFFLIYQSTLYLAIGDHYAAFWTLNQAKTIAPYLGEVDSLLAMVGPVDTTESTDPDVYTMEPPAFPPAGQVSYTDPVYILDTVLTAYQTAMSTYSAQIGQILGVGGESWNIEQTFLAECDDHAYTASQCVTACNLDLGCEAGCYADQCAADQASLATAVGLEGTIPGKGAAVYRTLLGDFLRVAWGVYYRHPDAVDRNYAYQSIVTATESIQSIIRGLYPESQETMAIWKADVAATCQMAADAALLAALEEIENMTLLSSSDTDAGICLIIICVSLANDKVSIGGNLFFVNVNLEVDIGGKDVTFGAGPAFGPFGSARLELSATGTVKVTETAQIPVGPYVSHSTNVAQLW